MNRRDFLVSGAVGAGALSLASCATTAARPATPRHGPLGSWQAVRDEFDGLARDRVHMSGFFLVSHPRRVRDAIEAHRRGLDADPIGYVEGNARRFEVAVRAAAARYLGVGADELAMTDSTTQGLGIVYGGFELAPGHEIVSTTHDHIVTNLALDYRAARAGTKVRRVALYDAPERASVAEIVARFERALTPATRLVAITWVHSGTGVKLPIKELADVVAKANERRAPADRALVCVDGVHGLGNQDIDLPALGCDVFIAGTHKWILGPRGTGIVWARPDAWRAMRPIITSMDPMWREGSPEQLPPAAWMTPGGFHSFEHRWALADAFALHDAIGGARRSRRGSASWPIAASRGSRSCAASPCARRCRPSCRPASSASRSPARRPSRSSPRSRRAGSSRR